MHSKIDMNDLPLDPPEFSETPGERTYTYLWGAADLVWSTDDSHRTAGVVAAIGAIGLASLGAWGLVHNASIGWVGIGIGVCLVPLAYIALTRRLDNQMESTQRRIRVCYDRGVVEFVECTFATGFVKTWHTDLYECPVDEIEGIDLFDPPDTSSREGSLRIWTARGHLSIWGRSEEIQRLHEALIAIAGDCRVVFWRRQWFFYTVAFLVAAAIAVVIFIYVL